MPIHVLFVCLGNICRSPAAQGVFEHLIQAAGLETQITVDSCGTAAFNIGKSPDSRSISAAKKRGYAIEQQIARQIDDTDYERAHYVVAMDRMNLTNVSAWALIFSRFNGHQNLIDEVSSAEIYKAKKDLAVFK
ncbi:low molecular weight protein-tyrosine-phosphatase [Zhongshania marina]|uniref:protein-tyrosine-phosphatase n=1 Tax=Zhongshania marina TaxID=2304603 RepID=A0ABX9W9Z4_9GAMM|nr:low molecular weight phosphotyrosine protein phosphatase [Zhongshania marina]